MNPHRLASLTLLAISIHASLLLVQPAALGQPPSTQLDLRKRDQVLRRRQPYVAPAEVAAQRIANTVRFKLDVGFALNTIDRDTEGKTKDVVWLRGYNGKLAGPVIRARPGDTLKIRLRNLIPDWAPDVPYTTPNKPNNFNTTNLHTHGLHVSPEGRSDNVFLEIKPEETIDLQIDVPPDHVPGTFWYHPHRHGCTALQVASGMSGALIIEGGLDDVPKIRAAMDNDREKILVFQQIPYNVYDNGIGEVRESDVYGSLVQRAARRTSNGLTPHPETTINGVIAPVICMRPGEIQRWRCVHAGLDHALNLALVPRAGGDLLSLCEISEDGLPLPALNPQPRILLFPGYRSDFLVQAPTASGEYLLKNEPLAASRSLNKAPTPEEYLAKVVVAGAQVTPPMTLPTSDELRQVVNKYPSLAPIADNEIVNKTPIKLAFDAPPQQMPPTINGLGFNKDRLDLLPRLKTAEEWTLTSVEDTHPFHVHVNPFEVISRNDQGAIVGRVWKDTYVVLEANDDTHPVIIRSRFRDYPGKTVLHCHNLKHEDGGMMMAIQLQAASATASRRETQPAASTPGTKAPPWHLLDFSEAAHCLSDYEGHGLMLLFFRGFGCPHCLEQLDAISRRIADFKTAKITIIGICPDRPNEVREARARGGLAACLPFLVLCDPALDTFAHYGCHDGRALHGTFVIDARGTVRWRSVGDEPFMDVDRLLKEAGALDKSRHP